MPRRSRRFVFAAALATTSIALGAEPAHAQQIKSRVMVLLDNSGSMGEHFSYATTLVPPPGGDFPGGDGSTSYSDATLTNQPWYPGKLLASGTRDGVNSRMYAAKKSLSDAVNAYASNIDFGLATYDFNSCAFGSPLCYTCQVAYCNTVGCYYCGPGYFYTSCNAYDCLYANPGFSAMASINQIALGCPGTSGGGLGGKILAMPSSSSASQLLPWIDGVEVFKDNGSGKPINPELRANGPTPLAASIDYVRTNWYDAVKNATSGSTLYDPQLLCRPYVLIVETDGADSCSGNVATAVKNLYSDNPSNPVLTYVIGVSINATDQATLNAAAANGGTGSARFATSPTDIQAAYADILSKSVKVELCNNKDDNCNAVVDEGFTKGALCTVGVGACQKTGITKCNATADGTTCCVNDGSTTTACTALVAGTGTKEICNGIDDDCNGVIDDGGVCATCTPTPEICDGLDNDCNGKIDDGVVGVGTSCGLSLGICTPGKTVCQNSAGGDVSKGATADSGDHIVCVGGTAAGSESCNGLDDDCDGVVDGMSKNCYSGPMGTLGVGICVGGSQKCNATPGSGKESWGACVGEVTPKTETCNGADDDCNGVVDDVKGAGDACCPLGNCGKGICKAGTMQCSGGTLQCIGAVGPQAEQCNGIDDDCDGTVDDLPGTGVACDTGSVICGAGVTACDPTAGKIVCKGLGTTGTKETCNGVDDDCNGVVDDVAAADDPKIGVPCGDATSLPPPCTQGKTICKNGTYVCDGEVKPGKEVCDGKDNDCDGKVDVGASCPSGYDCQSGGCYKPCDTGAIPCPGGYVCDPTTNHCLPGDCACAKCQKCTGGKCVDFCSDVKCPDTWKCECGACVDDSCVTKGCPDGQVCDKAARACVAAPAPDAGVDGGGDAGGGGAVDSGGGSGGCGCEVPGDGGDERTRGGAALGLAIGLGLVLARRQNRAAKGVR
jgi:hypothetical protein